MTADLLRVYLDPAEIDPDSGYPWQWKIGVRTLEGDPVGAPKRRIPDIVREQAGHRCVRCFHPFVVGETPGRWSRCDRRCAHFGPIRNRDAHLGAESPWVEHNLNAWGMTAGESIWDDGPTHAVERWEVEAEWRVLTVHHLSGVKVDCRWWNLPALCQRCHLTIQGKVHMQRPWRREHSTWFKPYVAAFYAWDKLGEELSRDETMARLDELLALEDVQGSLL